MPTIETFYPNADPETTSTDGGAIQEDPTGTFASLRAGAGGSATPTSLSGDYAVLRATAVSDQYNLMGRSIFLFDVSGFTGNPDNIVEIKVGLYITAKNDALGGGQAIGLVISAPASDTDVVAGDYDSLGTTRQASDLTIAGLTTSTYNYFTLNATGIATVKAAIAGDGIVRFGIRLACDIDNSAPTWVSGELAYADGNYADNGSNQPKLDITYTYEDIMDVSVGELTLTGINVALTFAYNMAVSVGSFLLTMKDAAITFVLNSAFTNQSKNAANPSNLSKNAISPTNQTKNSASMTNQTKDK